MWESPWPSFVYTVALCATAEIEGGEDHGNILVPPISTVPVVLPGTFLRLSLLNFVNKEMSARAWYFPRLRCAVCSSHGAN